jgi:hypothetical protein
MSVPSRRGQPWSDDEIQNLLQAVRKKESIEQIAQKHERTPGGIRSRLRELAAEYYFNDNRPIDEIMKFTGLDAETISDAISKRQYAMDLKEKKQSVQSLVMETTRPAEVKREYMTSVLVEIRDMMREMLAILKEKRSEN